VRTLVQREMGGALASYDALLTPTAPTAAYRLGEKSSDPLAMYKGDLMTVNVNLAGLPAIVLPAGFTAAAEGVGGGTRLPIGLQLIGRAFGEAELLQLAHVYEQTAALPALSAAWASA
ncbi:Glutamyl-tRNA(Gln) amidotransferase subunit A, chloroplastic/mitochondrial, partial [Tetrabaena socialis]